MRLEAELAEAGEGYVIQQVGGHDVLMLDRPRHKGRRETRNRHLTATVPSKGSENKLAATLESLTEEFPDDWVINRCSKTWEFEQPESKQKIRSISVARQYLEHMRKEPESQAAREAWFFPVKPKKERKKIRAKAKVTESHMAIMSKLKREFPQSWIVTRQYKNWLIISPDGQKFRSIATARNAVMRRGAASALLGMVASEEGEESEPPSGHQGEIDYLHDDDLEEVMEY